MELAKNYVWCSLISKMPKCIFSSNLDCREKVTWNKTYGSPRQVRGSVFNSIILLTTRWLVWISLIVSIIIYLYLAIANGFLCLYLSKGITFFPLPCSQSWFLQLWVTCWTQMLFFQTMKWACQTLKFMGLIMTTPWSFILNICTHSYSMLLEIFLLMSTG